MSGSGPPQNPKQMLRVLKKAITDQNTKYCNTTALTCGLPVCWLPCAVLILISHERHGRVGTERGDSKDRQT